jgi:nucleotide-binding universal stress UspA family protein
MAKAIFDEVITYDKTFKPKRVVALPIDGSKASNHTVDYSINNLLTKEDQVILIHCRNISIAATHQNQFDSTGGDFLMDTDDILKFDTYYKEASVDLLETAAKRFKSHGIHVRAISVMGDAREEIEKLVPYLNADFVVMGARGMGVVKRFLLGSVSNHVLHHVKVPVMIVPYKNA